MKKLICAGASAAAAAALLGVAAPAAAETLTVTTQAAPYCAIRLGRLASGTVSLAHDAGQLTADMQLACNLPSSKLTISVAHGDFALDNLAANAGVEGKIVNYKMAFNSTVDGYDIAEVDTSPSAKSFSSGVVPYSNAVAAGVTGEFILNVANHGNPDSDDQGGPNNGHEAEGVAAGNYVEVFTFELSPA